MRQPGASPLKAASGICVRCNAPFRYQYRNGRRSVCDACLDADRTGSKRYAPRPCPDCGRTMRRSPHASRCLSCQRSRQRDLGRAARTDAPQDRTTNCQGCGDQFTYRKAPGRGGVRRLCDNCQRERKQQWNETRRGPLRIAYGVKPTPCAQCGTEFQPSNLAHRYCSRACGARAHRARRATGNQPQLGVRNCQRCEVEFRQSAARQVFCSDGCRYQAFKEGRYSATAYAFTYRGLTVNLTASRVNQMRRDFGLLPDEYEARWTRQRGKCAICRSALTDKPHPHIDHDPRTMRVRGLLCASCNMALGYLKDDPTVIDRAAAYLRDSRNKGRSNGRQHDER